MNPVNVIHNFHGKRDSVGSASVSTLSETIVSPCPQATVGFEGYAVTLPNRYVPPILIFSNAAGCVQSRREGVCTLGMVVASPNPERVVGS